MIKIEIKPLSVNQAWKGRRFKTDAYKAFEKLLLMSLPKNIDVPSDRLKIVFEFGFSSTLSDIDNPVKMTLDVLSKKYNFNDRKAYRLEVDKVDVKKGEEYIKFEITKL
jgi:Holliday junction resolvase RusA-like endonuclease